MDIKTNTKNFRLVFSGLMVAIATVLSLFKFELPFGGSITIFSLVPLVLVAQMYGLGWGFLAATVYGFIQMVLGLAQSFLFLQYKQIYLAAYHIQK